MSASKIIEDKRAFWRFRHAQQCFNYAGKTSEYVLKEKWPADHPLIYQISAAIVVLYSRPFSSCFGIGKLGQEIVPKEFVSRHRRILAMRDKVFAHHDTGNFDDPVMADLRAGVILRISSEEAVVEIGEITLTDVALGQMQELSMAMENKCRWHLDKLMRKYGKSLPSRPGVYPLDLSDESPVLFSNAKPGTRK